MNNNKAKTYARLTTKFYDIRVVFDGYGDIVADQNCIVRDPILPIEIHHNRHHNKAQTE